MSALVSGHGLVWEAGGRRVLGPLDVEVASGECLVVLGPNGAGKTTLLKLLAGLLAPSAGRVAWRGGDLGALSRRARARRIAYVPQVRPERLPFTVEGFVLLGRYPYLGRLSLAPRREDFAAVRRALALVGIEALATRPLSELSGGERQAAFVAAALAQEAELLVLDEPTAHLDARHRRDVAEILGRLRAEGRTLVVATHELDLASRLGDRLLALADGRPAALGSAAEVVRPEVLADIFAAPFTLVRGGERPLAVLELDL